MGLACFQRRLQTDLNATLHQMLSVSMNMDVTVLENFSDALPIQNSVKGGASGPLMSSFIHSTIMYRDRPRSGPSCTGNSFFQGSRVKT